jgi:L-fuconolactonase
VEKHLDQFSGERYLKAVRHVVQGEPDPDFILRKDFNLGISRLKNYHLVYDILIFERQLRKRSGLSISIRSSSLF